MADLFERTGLEQDTGLLKQRWGQDGSTVVNIAGQETGDGTLRTVTAGKTLYLSDISIVNAGGNASFNLRDGNGGPIRFTGSFPATVGVSIQGFFQTPLVFETSVYFDEVGIIVADVNLTGWEE